MGEFRESAAGSLYVWCSRVHHAALRSMRLSSLSLSRVTLLPKEHIPIFLVKKSAARLMFSAPGGIFYCSARLAFFFLFRVYVCDAVSCSVYRRVVFLFGYVSWLTLIIFWTDRLSFALVYLVMCTSYIERSDFGNFFIFLKNFSQEVVFSKVLFGLTGAYESKYWKILRWVFIFLFF